MRIMTMLFILFTLSFAFATKEIVAPRVRVLYDNPEIAEYAQQVAFEAERALDVLIPLFKFQPRTITFILQEDTDVYNARVISLPHLKVLVRPLFPTEAQLGLRAQSDLYHLILHELTHGVQTTYTLSKSSEEIVTAKERGFLNPGGVASLPPAWFLEGIAVWVESTFTEGGRSGDALTTGILETLALDDKLPPLTEVGLATYSSWPGGDARYLLGGSFVEYLANTHGFEAILGTLQAYNRGGIIGGFLKDFSTAWKQSQGSSLNDEWLAWQEELKAKAQARAENAYDGKIQKGSGRWRTRSPVVSPEGNRLAWVSWPHIVIADINRDEEGNISLGEFERVISERIPNKLDWLDENTLVYTRFISSLKGNFSELFSVDITTGKEKQLTPSGTRVRLPTVTPNGCVLLVNDVVFNSNLLKWCPGKLKTLWQAPKEVHILGSTINEQGQIALSLWQRGFTDIALLNITTGEVSYLNQDAAQDLDPTWTLGNAIVFRSDRHMDEGEQGAFDLYQLDINTNTLTRLTRSFGGTFQPNISTWGIWHSTMTSKGSTIAILENEDTLFEKISLERTNLPPIIARQDFPVHSYNPLPSLLPYAVIPLLDFEVDELDASSVDFSIGAKLLAEDITEKHRYSVTAGYSNFSSGHLDGAFGYADYAYTFNPSALGAFTGPRLGLRLGLWPHLAHRRSFKETALGARSTLEFSIPLDGWIAYSRFRTGILHLESLDEFKFDGRATLLLSQQRRDSWGHGTKGVRFIARGIWSAAPVKPSKGAWGIVSYYQPLSLINLPGTLELYAQGGYRPSQPIPIPINNNVNGLASLGYRYTQPVQWRYGDGLYSLERINFTPRVRSWLDNDFHVGADLSIGLDTMINYMGAVSLSSTFGYAEGFWYRFGFGLSF